MENIKPINPSNALDLKRMHPAVFEICSPASLLCLTMQKFFNKLAGYF